jgi:hypothetical protein
MLDKLTDWKQFERLSADLLAAEGLSIDSEPSVDRSGTDFKATEEFRSHGGRVIRVRWRVQCKHYAKSGNSLKRDEAVKILHLFDLTAAPDEGLFVIVSTDYSEEAERAFNDYVVQHPTRRTMIWNQRQLIAKLERHPEILKRYGLRNVDSDFLSILASLKRRNPFNVLLISDQSALAHDIAKGLRQLGAKLIFVPFWTYQDSTRLQLLRRTLRDDHVDLVVCFLGDSFGLPLPGILIETILNCHQRGSAILLFPFLAWSLKRDINAGLRDIVPVELLDPLEAKEYGDTSVLDGYRKGDFRWLLAFDSFAEDQYVELTSEGNDKEFATGVSDKFGISHSFEYLRPLRGARVRFKDTVGNPFIVTREGVYGKICYLNTCCHSCLSSVPVLSPLSSSSDFSVLFRNVLSWLIGDESQS